MEEQLITNRIVKLIGDVQEQMRLREIEREVCQDKLELIYLYTEMLNAKNSSVAEKRGEE